MSAFASVDNYPFDLGVEGGGQKIFSLMAFSKSAGSTSTSAELDDPAVLSPIQLWLSRGLVWYYAFNHEEAIVCFQKALEIDANCVMAHYGISVSHAPNYNTETMNRDTFPSAKAAYDHCQTAIQLLSVPSIREALSDIEIALVEALPCRFNDPFATIPTGDAAEGEALPVEQNTDLFAESMRLAYEKYPNDPTVACGYAESLLNKSPWNLWDLNTGIPKDYAVVARDVIEKALLIAPNHPGLNHFMVHLMEMSPEPQQSLPSCKVLGMYFPHAGHLIHMPSHIYVLLGKWQEAVDSNVAASVADAVYVKKEGIYNYYTGYRLHNLHFIAYAALFAGKKCHGKKARN